ncbi:hypothetical protein HaLaN_28750 [Haematococcus lacustris]|uniref:Uncharacterized protein n=1 Tax=Haematococcus lacustris TaxID=44745 RepID=A0A6A0AB62_HAELA|nr:hypothetical protein HaLaN_28750 [Haematococcus lacustris]
MSGSMAGMTLHPADPAACLQQAGGHELPGTEQAEQAEPAGGRAVEASSSSRSSSEPEGGRAVSGKGGPSTLWQPPLTALRLALWGSRTTGCWQGARAAWWEDHGSMEGRRGGRCGKVHRQWKGLEVNHLSSALPPLPATPGPAHTSVPHYP